MTFTSEALRPTRGASCFQDRAFALPVLTPKLRHSGHVGMSPDATSPAFTHQRCPQSTHLASARVFTSRSPSCRHQRRRCVSEICRVTICWQDDEPSTVLQVNVAISVAVPAARPAHVYPVGLQRAHDAGDAGVDHHVFPLSGSVAREVRWYLDSNPHLCPMTTHHGTATSWNALMQAQKYSAIAIAARFSGCVGCSHEAKAGIRA